VAFWDDEWGLPLISVDEVANDNYAGSPEPSRAEPTEVSMCNLYNLTTTQDAIRSFISITHDSLGNMEPSIDVYPNRLAPIVRNIGNGERELANVCWGMPSSSQALFLASSKRADKLRAKGKPVDFDQLLKMEPDTGTTNIRNITSKHWMRWFGVENRCVVPVTRFAEPDPASKVEGARTPNAGLKVQAQIH
jgi:putative SOS response-associated peptidase YedK